MKKNLCFSLLILVTFTLGVVTTGSTMTQVDHQNDHGNNEIIFSLPVGDRGIHYSGNGDPEILPGGPEALTIAPDGTFWIADTADNHLLHYSTKGELLGKIAIGDYVNGAGDLEVTSQEIWILDMASIPLKIVKISLNGKVLNIYNLPKGLQREDGTTGIFLGSDGSLLVEREGGIAVTRFISPSGKLEQKALNGYESFGKAYSFQPGNLMSKMEASHGYVLFGDRQIDVDVTNNLGGLSILKIDPDGSFFIEVQEMVINSTIRVDQKVYHYDSSGNLIGMARVPLESQYVPVSHSISIENNDVYALITKPDGVEVQRLIFHDDLSPILTPPVVREKPEQSIMLLDITEDCRSRHAMIEVALDYYSNSTYLNSYHINDPNHECSTRTKPPNLTTQGLYPSVPYAWGMGDTVDQYNNFMGGGNNGKFAGDYTNPNSGCGRGVDCSGLVSNAWDLGSHYGTCSLEKDDISISLASFQDLRKGDIVNKCSTDPRHVILFEKFGNFGLGAGMYGYEATIAPNVYRVDHTFHLFSDISAYTPRRYKHACDKMYVPHIKRGLETKDTSPMPNPYPSPDSKSDTLSNPYP